MTDPVLELETYMRSDFKRAKLLGGDAMVIEEARQFETPTEFYKGSEAYLYHLTAYNLTDWKAPYYQFTREVAPACGVLDYGCGIGADGLALREFGYGPVAFADYQSKCTQYLRWRLKKRGIEADVYDVEQDDIPAFPLVVSFDVIEHVPPDEQWPFIQRLAELGQVVVLNMISKPSAYDAIGIHHPVDVPALLERVREEYLLMRHHIANHWVNLVAFRTNTPVSDDTQVKE